MWKIVSFLVFTSMINNANPQGIITLNQTERTWPTTLHTDYYSSVYKQFSCNKNISLPLTQVQFDVYQIFLFLANPVTESVMRANHIPTFVSVNHMETTMIQLLQPGTYYHDMSILYCWPGGRNFTVLRRKHTTKLKSHWTSALHFMEMSRNESIRLTCLQFQEFA